MEGEKEEGMVVQWISGWVGAIFGSLLIITLLFYWAFMDHLFIGNYFDSPFLSLVQFYATMMIIVGFAAGFVGHKTPIYKPMQIVAFIIIAYVIFTIGGGSGCSRGRPHLC